MSDIKYRVGRTDGKLTKGKDLEDSLRKLEHRAREFQGPWRIRARGRGQWLRVMPLKEAIAHIHGRLRKRSKNADLDAYLLRSPTADVEFIIREVLPPDEAELPSTANRWHPKIQRVYEIAFSDEFRGQTEFWGAENCRKNVLNTAVWSMHSYWPPVLAIDIGCSESVGARLWAKVNHELDDMWSVYHFGHRHIQVGGNRSGVPVCA